jgi:MurNAc alpha-1-phosphate uridylyltransferase
MKAMILAAGRGERLRPITDTLPKPLVEVRGRPLIVHHLDKLAACGVREVVINVSHLGALIERALGDGARWGLRIHWSREDAPLETAGGIAKALAVLGQAPFALLNADVYSDWDCAALPAMAAGIDSAGLLGHIVLVPNPPFRPGGDFSLAGDRVGNAGAPRYTYSGIGVLRAKMLDGVVAGDRAPLAPLLRSAAGQGLLAGELHRGQWSDVGTPERLAELNAPRKT